MSVPLPTFRTGADAAAQRERAVRLPRSAKDFLNDVDDDFLSCLSQRHSFPKLRPGPLPRGVRAKGVRVGVVQLIYVCPDCGTERTSVNGHHSYNWPEGYRPPPRSGLTKRDYREQLGKRMAPYIRAAAKEAAE